MWERIYSKTFKDVNRDQIWCVLKDVNSWHEWHGDLEYCTLKGEFAVGNYFTLKPKGAPAVKVFLTEINEGRGFTDCTNFFGAKMYNTHVLEDTEAGLKLTDTVVVTGPLRWLWIKLVAQNVADTASGQMEALVKRARGSNG